MQENITIADAPSVLNTNDKAMWVLGYQAAIDARKPCLHQIQEPAPVKAAQPEVIEALRALHDSVELALQRGHLSERALEIIIMQPATDVLMRSTTQAAIDTPVAVGKTGFQVVESVAQAIYEQWNGHEGYVPWQAGGNSHKQEYARSIARAALAAKG